MAIVLHTDDSISDHLEGRLRGLVRQARRLKSSSAVEPHLCCASLRADVDALYGASNDKQPASIALSLALENAARKVFYTLVRAAHIGDPEFVDVWNLLDLVIFCAERDQAEQNLPFYLIEDLIEAQTTDACRTVFDFLESRREKLLQKDFTKTYLVVLRFCNDLLRRLSRSEDAVFCGRVFFFLFQSFPLSDPSSVNLRGEYHTDNTTRFEDTSTNHDTIMGDVPTGSDSVVDTSSKETPGDYGTFYQTFWRLQQMFSAPTKLFADDDFEAFRNGLELTMTKFSETPVVVQTKSGEEGRGKIRKLGDGDPSHELAGQNAQYLTSRELFDLELSDLAFQRHILVQALILIDFLLSLTAKAKKKLADANFATVNKSVVYAYVLNDDKKIWALKTRSKIADYLQKGPDGNFYYRMVSTVLSRDKNWARWKIERCPEIVINAVPWRQVRSAKITAKKATTVKKSYSKPIGAIKVNFLTRERSNGLERLRSPAHCSPPDVTRLVEGIMMDKLDLEMAMGTEEANIRAAVDNKSWQVVRTISRRRFFQLDKLDSSESIDEVLKAHGQETFDPNRRTSLATPVPADFERNVPVMRGWP